MSAYLFIFADNGVIAEIKDVTACGDCKYFCESEMYDFCGLDSVMGIHGHIKVVSKVDACTNGVPKHGLQRPDRNR